MAADSKHGAPRWLAFICGALAVTLGLIGYQAYVGHNHARGGDRSLTVRLQAPDLPTRRLKRSHRQSRRDRRRTS